MELDYYLLLCLLSCLPLAIVLLWFVMSLSSGSQSTRVRPRYSAHVIRRTLLVGLVLLPHHILDASP